MSDSATPQFPLYIVSKGRADTRITARHLERMNVPYYIIVESQEYEAYAAHIAREKILVLDPEYLRVYETCDDLGATKSKGPGAARNFAWDHSIAAGHAWHWVMDDNIAGFYRFNNNLKIRVNDGTVFRCMEDFCLRYMNVAMAGPNYNMFVVGKKKYPPFVLNTRIYSCNLIRNDTPFRWRGRYNEDTDISLRMLKAGWCTVQFNAFLQFKPMTQTVKGGNNADFYEKEGTAPKSQMLVDLHPDVARLAYRFHRAHHHVDYRPFRKNKLVRRPGVVVEESVNEFGMELKQIAPVVRTSRVRAILENNA